MSNGNEVMSTSERLIYMANQIARNVAAEGEAEAVAATAQHITSFWDPRMRAQIASLALEKPAAFSPIAAAAIRRIAS